MSDTELTPAQEAGLPVFETLANMPPSELRDMVERALSVYLARADRGDLDGPGSDNGIVQYFHCARCLEELHAAGNPTSPEQNSRLSVGFTKRGIQVWCFRHDINVMHMDFEGVQHKANLTAEGTQQ